MQSRPEVGIAVNSRPSHYSSSSHPFLTVLPTLSPLTQSYFTIDCLPNQFLATSPLIPTTRIFVQLNTWGHSPYATSTLTRGWVCRLQLLLSLAPVILRFESSGTHGHILLSQIRYFPNLEGQVTVFISPRNRVARLYLQALVPFTSAPMTSKATVEVFDPASTPDSISTRCVCLVVFIPSAWVA
jgi:hypothetical protein